MTNFAGRWSTWMSLFCCMAQWLVMSFSKGFQKKRRGSKHFPLGFILQGKYNRKRALHKNEKNIFFCRLTTYYIATNIHSLTAYLHIVSVTQLQSNPKVPIWSFFSLLHTLENGRKLSPLKKVNPGWFLATVK